MLLLAVLMTALSFADGSALAAAADSDTCGPVRSTSVHSAAEEVYARARQAWGAMVYPAAAQFLITVHLQRASGPHSIHYQAEEEFAAKNVYVDRMSDEERANPVVPHGINVVATIGVSVGKGAFGRDDRAPVNLLRWQITPPEPTFDLLGTPHLSSAFAFGLRDATAQPIGVQSEPTNLKTIGTVATLARNYEIMCASTSPEDGDAVHLVLRPTHDPKRLRLRQLWIDPVTFAVRKIRSAGNFTDGPPLHVDWLTTYKQIEGSTYIDREMALGPLGYGRGKVYENVSLVFENLVPERRASVRMLLPQPLREGDLREP